LQVLVNFNWMKKAQTYEKQAAGSGHYLFSSHARGTADITLWRAGRALLRVQKKGASASMPLSV
jgi:hypothetical protein